MKLLIVSASLQEILNTINFVSAEQKTDDIYISSYKSNEITFLITGIGLTATAYKLTKTILNNKFDLILNVGIAGSFNKNLRIGDVVNVYSEQFGDLGVDDNGVFKTLFDENLLEDGFPYQNKQLINNSSIGFLSNLQQVKAISVNTISGSDRLIKARQKIFNADIETMEGSTVFFIALQEKINFAEIRAISNYVEPRNKANWDINLAISNLNNKIIEFVSFS